MIVLDTSVLLYAVGRPHRFAEPSARLIGAAGGGRLRATTTHEVIQEFTHVRARRHGRADAVGFARDYVGLFSPLLFVDDQTLRDGLSLFERDDRVGSFDAALVAAAVQAGARALVTADAGLLTIDLMTCLTPDDPEIEAIIRG